MYLRHLGFTELGKKPEKWTKGPFWFCPVLEPKHKSGIRLLWELPLIGAVWALQWLFCLEYLGHYPFPFMLSLSVGHIGKNSLLKVERFPRPVQPNLLPFCCDDPRLLAHFRAPPKFLCGCKKFVGILFLEVQRAWLPVSKGHQRVSQSVLWPGGRSLSKECFFTSFLIVCV